MNKVRKENSKQQQRQQHLSFYFLRSAQFENLPTSLSAQVRVFVVEPLLLLSPPLLTYPAVKADDNPIPAQSPSRSYLLTFCWYFEARIEEEEEEAFVTQ